MPNRQAPLFSRRRFLTRCAQGVALTAAPASYAHWVETKWFDVKHVDISISLGDRPQIEPIRLLHLSDLHADSEATLAFLHEAVDAGLALKPDVICITGDFIHRSQGIPPGLAPLLRKLAPIPTYACLGNHDGWLRDCVPDSFKMQAYLPTTGIRLLHNETATLSVRGRALEIVGLGDLWTWECLPEKAFPSAKRPQRPDRIVLSHNPDSKDKFKEFDWDLCLCGHTHGGQIGIPILQGLAAPVKDTRYVEGLNWYENRLIHVSRGIGSLYGVRFFCRPEINLLTIT